MSERKDELVSYAIQPSHKKKMRFPIINESMTYQLAIAHILSLDCDLAGDGGENH